MAARLLKMFVAVRIFNFASCPKICKDQPDFQKSDIKFGLALIQSVRNTAVKRTEFQTVGTRGACSYLFTDSA